MIYKHKLTKYLFSFILLSTLLIFYFSIDNRCKTKNLFLVIYDLGINSFQSCYGTKILEKTVKNIFKNNDFIFSNLRKVKRIIKKNTNPEIFTEIQITQQNKAYSSYENLPIPFIGGLINEKTYSKPKEVSKDPTYEYNEWYRSHGGNWNTHYDDGKYINKSNIINLKLAWKYSSLKTNEIKKNWKQNIEVNPVFINGKIIFVTADWKIVAVEVETGKKIWEINSISPSRRGLLVEFDQLTNKENLYVPILDRIYKFNATNGKVDKKFGRSGSIKVFSLTAPAIYKNYLISVNSSVTIIDKYTGQIKDNISLHPDNKNFSGGIAWTGFALDKDKGMIYASTGNPRPATVGISRPGKNKNSSSIVAVNLNKKKIVWDFQDVHHDLWDYDVVGPPIIHNLKLKRENKIYETVILLSKTGNLILLERNTGKPIFDINYRRAPKSKILGEVTEPFQINLKQPEKYSKIEFSKNDINMLSESKQEQILEKLENSNFGWFETPSFDKDLIIFGLHGGASWMGAGLDPINQNLYIPVNHMPWKIRPYFASTEIKPSFPNSLKQNYKFYNDNCSSCHGIKRNGRIIKDSEKLIERIPSLVGLSLSSKDNLISKLNNINNYHNSINLTIDQKKSLEILFSYWDKKIKEDKEIRIVSDSSSWSFFLTNDGMPASNPPWGYIAKLNLSNGELIFKKPIGFLSVDGQKKLVGTPNYGGLAINASGIIFFNGTNDNKAYALDAKNGNILWSFQMDAAGSAPPIIFNHKNKQYVSFVSTGGQFSFFKEKSSTIYTFSID